MGNDRHRAAYIPFRCSPDTEKMISDLALQRRQTKAEVLRDLVDKGLVAVGAKVETDYLHEVVKSTLEEVLRPSVERLASISAKATQIDAANFFMYIYALTRNGSEREHAEIQEAVEKARSLGIQYLKLRDRDLDSFIVGGAKQIIEEN